MKKLPFKNSDCRPMKHVPSSALSRRLTWIPLALTFSAFLGNPAAADQQIDQVNNLESMSLGVMPFHATEQAAQVGGPPFTNYEYGKELVVGYEIAKTRTFFGISNLYTNFQATLGDAHVGYWGTTINRTTGSLGTVDNTQDFVAERVDYRLGRSFPIDAAARYELTPYVDVGQEAWLRESSGDGNPTWYDHESLELGGMFQMSVTRKLVLGADASLGRTFEEVLFDGSIHERYRPYNATIGQFALSIDHRTYDDWHQRFELRARVLRYGEPNVSDLFMPKRTSEIEFVVQFGTERGFF